MRRIHAGLAIGVALALTVSAPAAASWTPRWFVELDGAPAAEGTSDAALDAEHRRFASEANRAGIDYRERFAYRTLFNGVSVTADDSEIAELRELDGVAAVYPVGTATLEQTAPAFDPELAFAITMTGVDVAQSRLGYTGRGVHVAVIDSGIDYDHPDLGGCFGPGAASRTATTSSATTTTTRRATWPGSRCRTPTPSRTTAPATEPTSRASSARRAISAAWPRRPPSAPIASSAAAAVRRPTSSSRRWSGSTATAPTY